MKTYVLDVLENILNEEQANQYYCKAFIEMNKKEKIPYIVNENRYLKFLLRLYKMDKNIDILEMIFKMSFRDVFGFQKNYRIYFSNLKILITSLTDYYYFITFLDKDEEKVKNLVKKSKLFLRWGEIWS